MKYVFPLFNNIEILLYNKLPLYKNSYRLYLINDTNYKIKFLEYPSSYIKDKYTIYDEVDMMANPLTCELNIPLNKDSLSTDILFKLAEILYDEIFSSDIFWKDITDKNKINTHYYIYHINKITYDKIINYFDTNKKIQEIENTFLKDYIKNNILIFILTKQFNLDYGMPENYNLDTAYIYKFKAIPYSAVDSPIIGSEFSDPILTYILTLFCYKIMKNSFRKIDKDYIVKYYSELYESTIDNQYILDILKGFFKINKDIPFEYTINNNQYINILKKNYKNNILFDYNYYIKNEKYYMDNYNDEFNIDSETLKNIIQKILEMNKTYYKECKNISFNDLLLSKNVKKFIGFTGTAYIKPPTGLSTDKNFEKDKYVTNSIIKNNTVVQNVENIINNSAIMINIYNNNNHERLIENIFSCLNSYDVLIDIGGVFINYNITKFIDKYRDITSRKKYFVYFDNGRKIINLDTLQVETDKSINKSKKDTFYFFNNKNLTGVDAKDIMNPQVHALVAITNKTNMRDFSQGIFRMRCLLDDKQHETFDIIFDKLFIASINQTAGGPHDCSSFNLNTNEDIRKKIIANLNYQQKILDVKKEKALIKQNIFGLIKIDPYSFQTIDLFIDPNNDDYGQISSEFIKNIQKFSSINCEFNIDNNNILNIINNFLASKNINLKTLFNYTDEEKIKSPIDIILIDLIKRYFLQESHEITSETKSNIIIEQIEENFQTLIIQPNDIFTNNTGVINPYFNYMKDNTYSKSMCDEMNENQKDELLYLYKFENRNEIFINKCEVLLIYDLKKNNLVILSINQLIRFLMYNSKINQYTFISLYNNNQYGHIIADNHKNYLILYALEIFKYKNKTTNVYLNQLILYLSINISKSTSSDTSEFKQLTLNFTNNYINQKLFYLKYLKYKHKYLNLMRENS